MGGRRIDRRDRGRETETEIKRETDRQMETETIQRYKDRKSGREIETYAKKNKNDSFLRLIIRF